MIIKLTLGGLVILLITVIATSYYVNKEGFDNITSQTLNSCTGQCKESLVATNNVCKVITQTDGNLVIYDSTNKPVWASNTSGKGVGPYKSVMQSDGNYVLYDSTGKPLWASNTYQKGVGPYRLVMQDDCNLVIYDKNNTPTWSSRANPAPNVSYNPAPAPVANAATPTAPASASPVIASQVAPPPIAPSNTPKPLLAAVIPQQLAGGSTPQRTEVTPEVSLSSSGYDAMVLQQKMDLLKDIQKVVRNELVANRATDPVAMVGSVNKVTDSTAQGKEYEESCYKDTEYKCPKNPDGTCPPIPDMSKYIKKDEIPCWGCAIDY